MASDSKETVDRRWSFPGFILLYYILFYFAFLYLCYTLFKGCNFTDDKFITHADVPQTDEDHEDFFSYLLNEDEVQLIM